MAEKPGSDRQRQCPAGGGVTYDSYLQIPKLLDCQKTISKDGSGKPFHVETLFILIHQVFELWFKQFLHDLYAVVDKLNPPNPSMADLQEVHIMMDRMVKIMKLLSNQFEILEDDASSRLHEHETEKTRKGMDLYETQRKEFEEDSCKKERWQGSRNNTLLQQIDHVLASLPDLDVFEDIYKERAKKRMTDAEEKGLEENFTLILDGHEYARRLQEGELRLSRKAFVGALMVFAHREEPFLQQLFPILTAARDLDALLFRWRANHVMMVQRMIGSKVGTGSSAGYSYLRSTLSDEYRVFSDLFLVATYLMPASYRDQFPLPAEVRRKLRTWQDSPEQ